MKQENRQVEKTQAERDKELNVLREWVKKVLPNDHDKFDTMAEYDSKLSLDENKEEMRKKLKLFITSLKDQAATAKAQQERLETERIKSAEREVDEYNKSLVYREVKGLETFYAPIVRTINKMCQGYSNLAFIKGRGGVGKSYWIKKTLLQNNADFVEVCGDVTEAYLYRLIFENNGKIIYFREVAKLLAGQHSINLLKSATETEDQKVLTKSNYSKDQKDLPDRFVCRCKFIFDYNNLFGSQLKEDFEALVTRGDYVELLFSDEDIINVMRCIANAQEDWQKEVTQELITNFRSNGLMKLNLRTQWKAYKTYQYALKNSLDWKQEIKNELNNVSKIRVMLYTLIGNRAVRTTELKKLLLRNELVHTVRTAEMRIIEWLFLDELYKWSEEDRNYVVCINPKK